MIYSVRWRATSDEIEYRSSNHLSTAEATDFACSVLDQMEVSDIAVVDGGGQKVVGMPEIIRYWRHRKAW